LGSKGRQVYKEEGITQAIPDVRFRFRREFDKDKKKQWAKKKPLELELFMGLLGRSFAKAEAA